MKLSLFGRLALALFASLALGLGMTACGGGTIGYLWVLGQQYNQISGFKIDDYTGNLTEIVGAPFTTNGANPVNMVIKPGGRYVFVLNQGTGGSATTLGTSAGVSVFSVGGDGTLTFQQSYSPQGYVPLWVQIDPTGSYLYVLTKFAPSYNTQDGLWDGPNAGSTGCTIGASCFPGQGAITTFAIDSNGRLSLVTNSALNIKVNGTNIPFVPVGKTPTTMKVFNSCVFTIDSADQTIYEYNIAGAGQLSAPTSPIYQVTNTNPGSKTPVLTSINGGGSYLYLTDSANNAVYQYTASGCTLTVPSAGGITANFTGTVNPVWSLVDSAGKYLYVLNSPNTSSQPGSSFSSISAWTINTNGQLQPINGAPYGVGAGPQCMVEDPSNQYMYISDYNDGTITGKLFDPNSGQLSQLSRGSTFPATGQLTCLAVSGAVN